MTPLESLSSRISTATGPGNVLDNAIAEYVVKDRYTAPDEDDYQALPYTTDVTIALKLAAGHVPGLAFAFLKHPNGMWSLAASDDGVPKYDGSMFEEQYLALSIVATVFETLVDRAARQQ